MVDTAPTDGPLARALEPRDWWWYDPPALQLRLIAYHLQVANAQRAGVGRDQFPHPPTPPWERETVTTTIGTPVPIDELDQIFGM